MGGVNRSGGSEKLPLESYEWPIKPHSGSIQFNPPQDNDSVIVGYLGGDAYDSLVGISIEDTIFSLENMQLVIRNRDQAQAHWTGLTGMEATNHTNFRR
jgi:hypothetical protein